ncbi:hypothetical protein EJB05_28613 [Eragrostis curvula]|uniref:FBD domain-containing protein n=1 Tax=Eragrostis curvula TaxID=38414 RepID=A0A5J9URT3_9POAL|nr:hypothetical protein EJB05_28613 [Eragrostis curvula]
MANALAFPHPALLCWRCLPPLASRAPFLEHMPLLLAADIRVEDHLSARMCKQNSFYGDCDDHRSYGCKDNNDGRSCVPLEGLSSATDLKLTSDLVWKDCQFCTTFSNLKTLLLIEWCMTSDFAALISFLRYTPILEKLTLQLECGEGRHAAAVMDKKYIPKEDFLV